MAAPTLTAAELLDLEPWPGEVPALNGGCRMPLSWVPHQLCALTISPWSKVGEMVVLKAHLSRWYAVIWQGRQ